MTGPSIMLTIAVILASNFVRRSGSGPRTPTRARGTIAASEVGQMAASD